MKTLFYLTYIFIIILGVPSVVNSNLGNICNTTCPTNTGFTNIF